MAAPKLEPVEDRDYVKEMRAVVDAETAHGPYVAAVVAEHIVRKLRVTDRDLLFGFLERQAEYLVRQMIIQRDCSARTHARTATPRSVFAEDAKLHEAGAEDAMVRWLHVPFVLEDGSRKRLAELTAAELEFVADRYDQRAKDNAMMAAFMRALKKRVGRKTVGDVYTDQQLAQMWASIGGE